MPNYTTNLNLEKPLQSEQYNVDVFNANADKIDAFAGQVPARALTADKLTTGANINGVNFKGDTNVITGLGLHSSTEVYAQNNLAYKVIDDSVVVKRSLVNNNTGDNFGDSDYWEDVALGGGSGYQMFDIVMKDHVLSYEETLGLAPLGTYVYKEAIAGTRYGYPDFYQKCVDEYNASSSIDITFEQPVLTANGTMGGSSFAVEASSYISSPDRNAYKSFDGNNATKWGVNNTTSGWLTFYNPQALKVSSIVYTPSTDFPGEDGGDLEISGSNDNSTWTSLWTGSYTANSIRTFNVDSQAYYNYYRITITNGVSNWVGLGDLTINATYLADYVENSNKHRFYDIVNKATFDNMYAITGEAWYYGIDTTNERIFLPRSTRFRNGVTSEVGKYQPAGLPNITGELSASHTTREWTGAFVRTQNLGFWSNGSSGWGGSLGYFDASRSSSIYGASDTVEYSSTKLIPYMVVGNQSTWSGMTDVVNQGMTILSQVNAGLATKLDLDLTNITNSTKSTIAGYAMPSDTYDDLTLGASGTTYTAPANGWFCLYRIPAVGYSKIENLTTGFIAETRNTVNGAGNGVWASVRKNDIIELMYDGGTNVTQWRFYYAVGSESEAS